jgi:membrane-bound lytic murein transglycosylase B
MIAAGIRPSLSIGELKTRGLLVQSPADDNTNATVFSLETEAGPQVMLGLHNFYVITRYNRSVNYAMAVYELAREIRAQMKPEVTPAADIASQR